MIADLLSHPTREKRDAACGDAKLVPLGKLAHKDRALRQSSQDRITLFASLLEMSAIIRHPRSEPHTNVLSARHPVTSVS